MGDSRLDDQSTRGSTQVDESPPQFLGGGLCVMGPDGAIQQMSAACAAVLGVDPTEAVGASIGDMLPELSPDDIASHLAQALAEGEAYMQLRHRRRNGRPLTLELSSASIELVGARHLFAFIRERDGRTELTAKPVGRVRHNYRRRESNEGSFDVIFQTDAEGRWTFLDPTWTDVTGFPVDASIGRPCVEFVHADDRERTLGVFDALRLCAAEYCRQELRYLTRAGHYGWMEVHARAILAGHELLGTTGILRDISMRKRVDTVPGSSEERYHQMFNGNHAVQLIVDPTHGDIIDANRAAVAFYGYPLDRLRQMRISDINTMPAEQIEREMRRAREQRRNHFFFVHRLADGQLRNVEVHTSPMRVGGRNFLFSIVHDVTDRIRAEYAMRRSEAQLRLITDSLPVLITYIDTEVRYRFNNRTYSEWFGLAPGELYGQRVRDTLGEDAYASIAEKVQAALRGEFVSFETEMGFRDGSIRHLLVQYVPDIGSNAVVNGFVALITDITDRKRAQEDLVEKTARLQMMTNQVPAVLWTTDRDLRLTSSQGAALARLDLAPHDIAGMSVHEYFGQTSINSKPNAAHLSALDGEPSRYALEWENVVFECYVEPLRDSDGHINGVVGLALDATEQHRAADALRESEERFRVAFHTSPDAITISRLNGGRIIDVNDGFLTLTGYIREEVVGRTNGDLNIWSDADGRRRLIDGLRGRGYVQNMEAIFRTKSGDGRTGLVSATIIHLHGEPHILAVTRDIEELKQAQHALERSAAEWTYAMDFLEDGICLLDLSGRLLRANRAFRQMVAADSELHIGQEIVDVLHPNGYTHCAICEAFLGRHDATEVFEAGDTNNPTDRPIEIMLRVIRDEGEQPTGFLLGLRDLTRTRQTEMELRRLNSHIRLLLESAGEGIYGVDTSGRCTFINQAALDMLGYERNCVVGCFMHELAHHTLADGVAYRFEDSALYEALTAAQSCRVDDEVMWRKDGTSFPVEYSSYPVQDDGRAQGAVVVFRNVTEAKAMARQMDYLASHDMLTGLVNRHEFERRLSHALGLSRHEHSEHVLCYMDLDQFKVVNDTCGHVAGDELLRQLGAVMHGRLRQSDTLARLGGDEFGVLLEHCPMSKALSVIDDLRITIDEFRFVWEDKTFAIGASVGAVSITCDTDSIASALSAADTACYVAKESGRNRVHVYQIDDVELALRHGEMRWVSRIQDAIEHDRFELNYQPIVSLNAKASGECFEVLLRMVGADGESIPPGAFLPAAERYNLITAIDRWVVSHAFEWLAAHRERLETLSLCTLNLSGNTLADDTFVNFVIGQIKEHEIPAHKVCFEITETVAIANLSRAVVFIGALRRLGCRFALDDFGSGMSSFAYLKNLPIDLVKIDGNFVRDIRSDPVDCAMVEAINQVGHVMAIQTVAEHVEDEFTLELLRHMGVDYAQGHYVAMPRPFDTAPAATGL